MPNNGDVRIVSKMPSSQTIPIQRSVSPNDEHLPQSLPETYFLRNVVPPDLDHIPSSTISSLTMILWMDPVLCESGKLLLKQLKNKFPSQRRGGENGPMQDPIQMSLFHLPFLAKKLGRIRSGSRRLYRRRALVWKQKMDNLSVIRLNSPGLEDQKEWAMD